jgi:hypothetical protein
MKNPSKYGPIIPQTWRSISVGSPFGTVIVSDAKGKPTQVPANRAQRRADRARTMSRLERTAGQEERRDSLRRRVRRENRRKRSA